MGITLQYETIIGIIWTIEYGVLRQTALLLVVWLHLMIGLHYWQRLRPDYPRWLPLWQLLASLLPILSLLGFYRLGYQLDPVDLASRVANLTSQHPQEMAVIGGLNDQLLYGYLIILLLVLLIRFIRHQYRTGIAAVMVDHPQHGLFAAQSGQTLLEALRQAKIAHSSVCGGRARCTTCRVRVVRGQEQLEPPSMAERKALAGIKADVNVRLACQLRLTQDIAIVPLIPPEMGAAYVRKPGGVEGQEQRVTVLFIDLRGSTKLAEQRLPYDVVFILNQFFAEMAEVLRQTEGHYAQFNGDGLMALYGLKGDYDAGCRQAVIAAQQMLKRLVLLNRRLGSELRKPLRVGIGIHSGEAIVGTMGPPQAPILSAIGDTINIAARIEAETKKYGVSLILSQETHDCSGLSWPDSEFKKITVRGRDQLLDIVVIRNPLAVEFNR
jgi:adenylate cyclase